MKSLYMYIRRERRNLAMISTKGTINERLDWNWLCALFIILIVTLAGLKFVQILATADFPTGIRPLREESLQLELHEKEFDYNSKHIKKIIDNSDIALLEPICNTKIITVYNGVREIPVILDFTEGAFICAYGAGEEYVYTLTPDQMTLLAQKIHAEAGNQSLEGKVAIGAVALNRYASGNEDFGKTIDGILNKEGQFAPTIEMTEEQMQECMQAAELACRGWDPTRRAFENGALYFYSEGADLSGRGEVPKYIIEDHTFTHLYGK